MIIPALNEERTIVRCLASVARQTLRPRRVMLIDDGSRDGRSRSREAFARQEGLNLTVIRRAKPIGKTPTIKRQARELDSDVEFILDGDTILESDTYIARTVEELYKASASRALAARSCRCASATGRSSTHNRRSPDSRRSVPTAQLDDARSALVRRAANGITNLYRECCICSCSASSISGQMVFVRHRSPTRSGCAVAYRRKYIKDLFDHYDADLRRRPHELRRHLHRVRAAQRGLSQHPAHRRATRGPSSPRCSAFRGSSICGRRRSCSAATTSTIWSAPHREV